ncbi:histidine phosphatase family protein [Nocardioides piscis]|uniref:Histidine phosphatase family protein n=2 Tax=Nocardioides piscis TaxID=2714938 RepID=A0A6G7YL43_9ACTN|nr:histidine phosphatase family protein [Nocardioides piscis]
MRHAKAQSWGETDHDRPLADRGRDDAVAAGRWVAEQGVVVDAALISSAARTQATWAGVAEGAGWDAHPVVSDALYAAEPDAALDLIRETPEQAGSLMVLGHNPTVGYLAQLLDDGHGDPEASISMIGGFPPCALAVFSFEGRWADLDLGAATVQSFHVGRA